MSTVNFSVPEDVKRAFNETFKNTNKSAIIAGLMMQAVERERRRDRARQAFDRIMERRQRASAATDAEIARARKAGRS